VLGRLGEDGGAELVDELGLDLGGGVAGGDALADERLHPRLRSASSTGRAWSCRWDRTISRLEVGRFGRLSACARRRCGEQEGNAIATSFTAREREADAAGRTSRGCAHLDAAGDPLADQPSLPVDEKVSGNPVTPHLPRVDPSPS